MEEFISEPIRALAGTFDPAAMGAGLPGLPRGFTWRDQSYEIVDVLRSWKASGPEVGRLHGERYLRRHYSRLKMSDGSVWTVYFVRHTPQRGSARRRWFLYSIKGLERT
jgi:hypothetical protein